MWVPIRPPYQKGSFKGDIDIGTDIGVDMDIDSDMAVSVNWGSFKRSLSLGLL